VGLAAQSNACSSRGQTAIAGLEIAGMMQPARGVAAITTTISHQRANHPDGHCRRIRQRRSAALLMSATAAAMQLEANHDRNMLEMVKRLNTESIPCRMANAT